MCISICVFKSLNLRHLRFLRQIFPSSKSISGCVQIVTFTNVSLFQPLTRLRLNIASSLTVEILSCTTSFIGGILVTDFSHKNITPPCPRVYLNSSELAYLLDHMIYIVRGLPWVTIPPPPPPPPPPPRAVPPWFGFVGRKVRIRNHNVNIAYTLMNTSFWEISLKND